MHMHPSDVVDKIRKLCRDKGLRMTAQRKMIAQVIAEAKDHPDVYQIYQRIRAIDKNISLATVYRTVKLLYEADIVDRRQFGDGRGRYEKSDRGHHDHLIDLNTGKVVEFRNKDIETLQEKIAQNMGYKLIDHRLELFAVPLDEVVSQDQSSQYWHKKDGSD